MPEQNKKIKPNFQGEKNADEEILKLGRKAHIYTAGLQ